MLSSAWLKVRLTVDALAVAAFLMLWLSVWPLWLVWKRNLTPHTN